jgi:hypothetical protein
MPLELFEISLDSGMPLGVYRLLARSGPVSHWLEHAGFLGALTAFLFTTA